MKKLSAKSRLTVIRQYLSGLSYDEIAARDKVSKGTVANVVADLKAGRFPEAADAAEHIDLLRELSLNIKQSNLTPGQCATGLAVLTRINECGLDPADIGRWPLILKLAGDEEKAREFVRLSYSIQEVQTRTGLSLEELDDKAHELERKAADLESVSKQYEDYHKQIAELTRQREKLTTAIASLEEKYQLLYPRVKDLEKRENDLSRRIADMEPKAQKAEAALAGSVKELQRLQDIGLPSEALVEFSERVHSFALHHHVTTLELRDRLLRELGSLSQGLGLEVILQSRHEELDKMAQAIIKAKKELETTKAVVDSLKQERANLQASIKETREQVSKEIAKIIPIARSTINQFVAELQRGHNEALKEVRQLRDETLEVGKELGRFEGILQANQWLSDLLALVRGDENLDAKQIRAILLLVLRGAAAWLKHTETPNQVFSSPLSLATGNLIREVEQWKT